LDWDLFPGTGTEQRLSHLCYWVLEFDRRREEYGLRLSGVVIEPAVGEKHRDRVLKELALYSKEGWGR
jgi:KaiC/GvpD/RAD55 family RecA-like ATPase